MRLLLVLAVLFVSCSSPAVEVDVSAVSDAAPGDMGGSDVEPDVRDVGDAREIGAVDEDTGSDFTLAIDSGGVQATFEHARYGLTDPSMSTSGEWEIYVEIYRGGEQACPTETSATPDQTVIVSGLHVSHAPPTVVSESDGLSVVLLDFEGLVTTEPILRATSEQATIEGSNVCTECPGEDDRDGFVAFELSAPLDDGVIEGRVHATHCASLDTAP